MKLLRSCLNFSQKFFYGPSRYMFLKKNRGISTRKNCLAVNHEGVMRHPGMSFFQRLATFKKGGWPCSGHPPVYKFHDAVRNCIWRKQ